MSHQRSGLPPEANRRVDLLPIVSGIPVPPVSRRFVMRNTLLAMKPGDSILVTGSQLSNVYKLAQTYRLHIRMKLLDGVPRTKSATYRIWKV